MHDLPLLGCTPEPLMSYLKALGVFRLVAEQADPAARLSWRSGVAVLHTTLDRTALSRFFLDEYQPTPVMAPWNGGSGFYGGGAEPLKAIESSTLPRFSGYRRAIASARTIVPEGKPKDESKDALLVACRARLADEVVPWLDACFVLSETGPSFFPLLGTGGNDGRLEFTNNFMQRVAEVLPLTEEVRPKDSAAHLDASLFADALVALGKAAVGQFNPGGIGGANGTQGRFEADGRVNPWDYVLMIEGALVFAGATARRLGASGSSRAAFPFMVDSIAVGYGSATAGEETTDGSRSELWLPLWEAPATLPEIRQLFGEGRAQLGRRQARNAVEFALAASLLGVDRGVAEFARYGFLKRNGLAFLATPLGRIAVKPRPLARLLEDPPLSGWLDRWRRACGDKDKTPARYQAALRGIDRAMFAFAHRSEKTNDAACLIEVLRAVGSAERTLSAGLSFAEDKFLRPLSGLSSEWLDQADDGSAEFRLAASLAGMLGSAKGEVGPLRVYMEPVEVTKYVNWAPGSVSAVWSRRPLVENLAAVFRRRQMEAFRAGLAGVPNYSRRFAGLDDIAGFLNGEADGFKFDYDKLGELLWGMLGVEMPTTTAFANPPESFVTIAFGVPKLLVQEAAFVRADNGVWKMGEGDPNAKPEPQVFHLLAAERLPDALARAKRRLNAGGLKVAEYRDLAEAGSGLEGATAVDPTRLLAAMLFPLSHDDLARLANQVLYPPETEE